MPHGDRAARRHRRAHRHHGGRRAGAGGCAAIAGQAHDRKTGPLSYLARTLLDLIFPARCLSCRRLGSYFCAACQAAVDGMPDPFCPTCGHLVDPADPRCRCALPAPDFVVAAGAYGGTLRKAILSLKYRGQHAGAPTLAALLASRTGSILQPDHLIVPVPLHPRRQRERGYNQSALLARALAQQYGMQIGDRALRRTRYTERQVALTDRSARRRNVRGAFTADPATCAGRTVMLVDDVCTTGATLNAAARAVLEAGAHRVYAAVLARATPGQDR